MSTRFSTQANNYISPVQAETISTPSRDTQVQIQLKELSSACEELIQNLVALDDRLYSILKPSVPVEGTVYAEDEATVPLANALMVITRTIKDAIGRVDSILHRCEL